MTLLILLFYCIYKQSLEISAILGLTSNWSVLDVGFSNGLCFEIDLNKSLNKDHMHNISPLIKLRYGRIKSAFYYGCKKIQVEIESQGVSLEPL